jgi:hypothetical protein
MYFWFEWVGDKKNRVLIQRLDVGYKNEARIYTTKRGGDDAE